MPPDHSWQISVDTGGTFTDAYAICPDGSERRTKLLSSGTLRAGVQRRLGARTLELDRDFDAGDGVLVGFELAGGDGAKVVVWNAGQRRLEFDRELPPETPREVDLSTGEEVPIIAARLLTGTAPGEAFPAMDFRLATTRATNALLESKGTPPWLLLPEGLGDLLEIGDQRRPDLFALQHRKRRLPLAGTIEVRGRCAPDGSIIEELDLEDLRIQLKAVPDAAKQVAAVALLHSYANPTQELAVANLLQETGFSQISLSSQLAPGIRILPRAQTSAVNACLAPIMDGFVAAVASAIGDDFFMMNSAGGLVPAKEFHPKDGLLSGPAGGLVGALQVARSAGLKRFIGFDMGGTSTDVARVGEQLPYVFEHRIGAARIFAPALHIETVAAGGGSICALKPEGLSVGPESAGADPGPACYGRGGPLTLTDVNLLLGRLECSTARIPLDAAASRDALHDLQEEMRQAGMEIPPESELLRALLQIAVDRMAEAIRKISVREGYDPRDHTLVAFGGAGPQHACALADSLGIDKVLVPADAGLLSARGLAAARRECFATRNVLQPLSEVLGLLPGWIDGLESEVLGAELTSIHSRIAELRLAGQETTIDIEFEHPEKLRELFEERFVRLFGYPPAANRTIELVNLRVGSAAAKQPINPEQFDRPQTQANCSVASGPFFTLVIESGWSSRRGKDGSILLDRSAGRDSSPLPGSAPMELEIARHRLAGIVTGMGALLKRCAISVNVREREDYSCAILDADGRLAINAPHIPVHLGALGLCVREVARRIEIGPGDVVITNHPGCGGSHLPDITAISAVFDASGRRVAYLANRAHHAEIGGATPGSMPPSATSLVEEGVVIKPCYLMRAGQPRFETLAELLQSAPFPSRSPDDNLADLQAQAAALRFGAEAIQAMDADLCRAALAKLLQRSARIARTRIAELPFRKAEGRQELDDGSPICLRLERDGSRLRFDFSGTAPVLPGNLNATPAIVRSAVLYVLRLMIEEELPLNEGLLESVEIRLPPCFLNPVFPADPRECPPVVGGNIETSQRIVDTVIEALGLQACSQGTMNNLLFGNQDFGYYETIAGGSGAGPGYAGTDALHTHMTNTAITDPEILEWRYPVRLREFSVRRGSGGEGKHRGGDGCVRELELLEPLSVSLLAEHRVQRPFGMKGGSTGTPGAQFLMHPDGRRELLPAHFSAELPAGVRIRIETPGGGGYGR